MKLSSAWFYLLATLFLIRHITIVTFPFAQLKAKSFWLLHVALHRDQPTTVSLLVELIYYLQ